MTIEQYEAPTHEVDVPRQAGALALAADQTDWTTPQQAALVQLGIAEAPKADQQVFMHVAQRSGLDPFARQIYLIGRNDREAPGGKKWTIQTGIDGFRVMAERRPEYAGQTAPQWCDSNGQWHEVWLNKDTPPSAARVGVYRHDRDQITWAIAHFWEFAQTKYGGDLNAMWKGKPANQIAKCLPSSAKLETDRGLLTIGQIVRERLDVRVRSVDLDSGQEVWGRVVNWWRNPSTDQWVTIDAPSGVRGKRGIRVTPDHPIWTPHGWQKAGELAVGDQIAVTSPTLSEQQHQVILGGLLGDGSLTGRRRSSSYVPHYAETHSAAQGDYLRWKAGALSNLRSVVTESSATDGAGGTHPVVRMRTAAVPALRPYGSMKPADYLDGLTDLGVAVWLMDDGSIKSTGSKIRTPCIQVYCCGFGAEFADIAAEFFVERYGIEDVSVRRRDRNPYLAIGVEGTQVILRRIAPWLVYDREAGAKRWVAGEVKQGAKAGTVFVPVARVDHRSGGEPEGRYDIEVEGTHTFVYRNVVISNCAEAAALRKAFPQDFSGLYISEEMDAAENGSRAPMRAKAQRTGVSVAALTGNAPKPTPPAEPEQSAVEMIDKQQWTEITRHFKAADVPGADRGPVVDQIVGREVGGMKNLTHAEAANLATKLAELGPSGVARAAGIEVAEHEDEPVESEPDEYVADPANDPWGQQTLGGEEK